MSRIQLLLHILITSVAIAALHFLALELFLYWELVWFDVIMHFLGGFLMGLTGLWLIFYSMYVRHSLSPSKRTFFLVALGSAVFVGVGWEIWEYIYDLTTQYNYAFDTTLDLVMDVIGGFAAFQWVYSRRGSFVK